MNDPDALHDHLAEVFDFPDWYGRNLDAFWDMLCQYSGENGPISVRWAYYTQARSALGEYACKVKECLQ